MFGVPLYFTAINTGDRLRVSNSSDGSRADSSCDVQRGGAAAIALLIGLRDRFSQLLKAFGGDSHDRTSQVGGVDARVGCEPSRPSEHHSRYESGISDTQAIVPPETLAKRTNSSACSSSPGVLDKQ